MKKKAELMISDYGHHHAGPRTLIWGSMAPCRLRPAGLFYRIAKITIAYFKGIDKFLTVYPPSLWSSDHAQFWRVFVFRGGVA